MPHMKAAFDKLDELAPTLAHSAPKTMLYVGWRHDCHPWWYTKFAPALGIEKVTILEIFPPNVAHAEQMAWEGKFPIMTDVICGNILKYKELFTHGQFDVIFWDHGPEHVTAEQLIEISYELQGARKKALIYSCPWGRWSQGAEGGNEHERHLWDVTPEFIQEKLGMFVFTVGTSGQEHGGEIIAIG